MGATVASSVAALGEGHLDRLEVLTGEVEPRVGELVELDGPHGVEREPRDIPILIGATGPKMLEFSGEEADGVVLNAMTSVEYLQSSLERIRTGAERAGRDVAELDLPQLVLVAMGTDGAAAREEARRLVTMYLGQQPHLAKASNVPDKLLDDIQESLGGWPASEEALLRTMELVPDEIVNRLTAAGTPEECYARVKEYLDAGATSVLLSPITSNIEEMLRYFARD